MTGLLDGKVAIILCSVDGPVRTMISKESVTYILLAPTGGAQHIPPITTTDTKPHCSREHIEGLLLS